MVNFILLTLILIIVLWSFIKDYYGGLIVSIFFLISMPENLSIHLPGAVPDFTLQRLILILAILFYFRYRIYENKIKIQFYKILIGVAGSVLVSTLFSVVVLVSLKAAFSFIFEQVIFYVILFKSFANLPEEKLGQFCVNILNTVTCAIGLVTLIGVFERWSGFSFVSSYLPSITAAGMPEGYYHSYKRRIASTFPHPILFGYGLSMWWPVMLITIEKITNIRKKVILGLIFFLTCSCIYFSESRGPWIGSIIIGLIMMTFGDRRIRKKMMVLTFVFFLVLILRPQIQSTIINSLSTMLDKKATSLKSRSYHYRFELWWKANREISKSPIRFLFGYGDNSRHYMDLTGVEKISGRISYFWSWDNEYAAVLLERGYIGFIMFVLLYFFIAKKFFKLVLTSNYKEKNMVTVLFSGIMLYIFMMTNVKVFSSQINFLFWTIVTTGLFYPKRRIIERKELV